MLFLGVLKKLIEFVHNVLDLKPHFRLTPALDPLFPRFLITRRKIPLLLLGFLTVRRKRLLALLLGLLIGTRLFARKHALDGTHRLKAKKLSVKNADAVGKFVCLKAKGIDGLGIPRPLRKGKLLDLGAKLSRLLPAAVMGMLVVYCLRDVSFAHTADYLPALASALIVALLHVWRRNTLISILGGTLCYMMAVQFLF